MGHGGVEAGVAGEGGGLQPFSGLSPGDRLAEVDIVQFQGGDHGVLDNGGFGVEDWVAYYA